MKTFLITILSVLSVTIIDAQNISADFPFESKYIEILESKIHYIEEYKDSSNTDQLTFLFLHGNPTSSYLWRNVIPYVKGQGKAIAVDLIGMGKSGKPNINYTFQDHINYVEEFIRQKDLKNIVLVLHDWGSAIGFNYAANNESNIKGIVFMEAITETMSWKAMNFMERYMFKKFRDDKKGHEMIAENNFFMKTIVFKMGTKRKLTEQEKEYYNAPYPTVESRKPIEVWPKEIPIDGIPERNHVIVTNYSQWLKETTIPKLFLYASPGMILKKKEVENIKSELKNIETIYVGKGTHYIQEDHPHEIGNAIQEWTKKLTK